jgi:Ca-activated chloride channel family protein
MTDVLSFEHRQLFWLLLAAFGLVAWAVAQHVGRAKQLARLGDGPVVQALVRAWSPRRAAVRIALVGTALALLVVALARPRYGLRETEVSNAGIDVAIVVDASKSMLVKDVLPNRLQGTALEIKSVLDRLTGGRVALVPFAGIPFVQCPLTTDRDVIQTYMADLKPEDIPVGGTNIGRAITLAVDLLTGESERKQAAENDNLMPQFHGSRHKAILLFSDGEDHEGAAVEAAEKAKAAGIRIYTVGVGSAFGDPVPLLGPDGTATGVLKDEQGNPVFSKLNLALLQQVAQATGGQSFHYGNKSVAPQISSALDQLEKAEYQAQFQSLGEDRYQWLLGPALLLLLIDAGLTNRRRRRGQRRPGKAVVATALLGLLVAQPVLAVPRWLQHDNGDVEAGRAKLQEQKYGEALKAFEDARATRPEHVVLWYDLGLAQSWLGARQEAITSFGRALAGLRAPDAALEADIHYASGTTELAWARSLEQQAAQVKPPPPKDDKPRDGKIEAKDDKSKDDKAGRNDQPTDAPADPLPHYKAAVASLELALLAAPERSEIRRNLELARLGAFPPCRKRDRKDEPNDQVAQATPVQFADGQREQTLDERSCPDDRDLFAVQLQPGDRFSAAVATKADTQPQAEEAGATARLQVALVNASASEVLRGPTADSVDLGTVAKAQTVLVDVKNPAEVETPYDLKLKLLPACQRIEDRYEPNDAPAQARALTVGEPVQARICPLNDDHFAVTLQAGQGLAVKAKSKVDIGVDQLEVQVLGPDAQVVAKARRGKDGMVGRLAAAPADGTYVVQVRGGLDTEADYELAVQVLPACRERDDPYEDNDQAVAGNPLTEQLMSQPLAPLQLCPGDDDWFAVQLKEGESLFVDLQAQVEDLPDAQDLAGALTLEVWDDQGTRWGEAVGGPVQGGAIVRTAVVLAPPPGTYRVRVTGGGVAAPTFPLPEVPQTPPGPGGLPGLPPMPGAQPMPPLPPPPGLGQGQGGQNPPAQGAPAEPPPVPHVTLPPGFPQPTVDVRKAKLDVPYQLKLRILPPCPAGNDELEPDDSAAAAKPIEVGNEQLLRICKGDQDWLSVTQKAGQALQVSARFDLSHGVVAMEAFDDAGQKSLAKGEVRGPDAAQLPPGDSPEARKGKTAINGLQLPAPKTDRVVKLKANADAAVENFYLLRIEEPPPPSDKDPQSQPQDDKKEPKEPQEPPPEPKPDEQERERQKQQMERNDHDPQNLEAQEALRKSQFRNETPSKDW